MKTKFARLNGLLVLAAGLLSTASLLGQSLTFDPSAPVPAANDIYNFTGSPNDSGNVNDGTQIYPDGAANDGFTYVASGRADMGQTFTTGPTAGVVTAIWIRNAGYTTDTVDTYWGFGSGGVFNFRITNPSQVNTPAFAIDTESYTVTGLEPNNPTPNGGVGFSLTGTGLWLRFGLTNQVTLLPNTVYGFDVIGQTGDFFETLGTTNDVYSGGTAYIGTAAGGSAGAPDDTLIPLVGDRVFLVEMNGGTFAPPPIIAPTITNNMANVMVPQGANGVFTPVVNGTTPFAYQWYYNTNTPLVGETNATLTLGGVTTNQVGGYSVIVTNSSGSATSQVARLAVILPAITSNLDFSVPSGTILDQNGVATGLSTRLAGTGASIPTDDPFLLLDSADGVLDITSPTCDFNGQLAMNSAEAIGFNLSTLGFNGTQDFTVTGYLTNSVVGQNYDQAGIFAGSASTNFVRDGIIYNTDFAADPGAYGVGNQNGGDIGIATAAAPVGEMVAIIARAGGVWSMSVNGLGVTPNASLTYLNSSTDMTVGVFALNTSGTSTSTTVNGLSASLFTGPHLQIAKSGGNLQLNWNVVSSGLLWSTNLANPNGWQPVAGVTGTSYTVPMPASGNLFYRIAP